MIRLLLADLWEHRNVWFGVVAVAMAFGYVGGWFATFTATATMDPGAEYAFFFKSAAQAILMFSTVAALAVLASTTQGCIGALRRVYALWQLVNVPPATVGVLALAQIAVAVGIGSCTGLALQGISAALALKLLFAGVDLFEGVQFHRGMELYPAVLAVAMS